MAKKQRKSELFKPLVNDLTRPEWESLIRHVSAYQDYDEKSRNLALAILDAIENNPEQKEAEIFKKIKINTLRPVERYALLRKLRNLILEAISLQINLDRPGIYGNAYRQRATNSRKWVQATIFIEKNKIKEAQKLLDDIQSKALKYEHFDQLSQALETSLLITVPKSTTKTLGNITTELKAAREKRNMLEAATLVFIHARSSSFLTRISKEAAYTHAVEQLDAISPKGEIATVTYFKNVLMAEAFAMQARPKEQLGILAALVDMCRNVPALQSTDRIFSGIEQQVAIYASQHDFKNALLSIGEAQELVKRDSFAYFNLQIKEIQIQLYLKKFDLVIDQMSILLKSRYTEKLPFALSYYNYFLAAAEFYSGNTENAVKPILELLEENLANERSLDLMGSLLAIQIAENLRSTADTRSHEMLKKSKDKLEDLKANFKMDGRRTSLMQIFTNMADSDFQPKKGNWYKLAQKLNQSTSKDFWEPLSLENFPLDEWVIAKAEKRKLWMKIKPKAQTGA